MAAVELTFLASWRCPFVKVTHTKNFDRVEPIKNGHNCKTYMKPLTRASHFIKIIVSIAAHKIEPKGEQNSRLCSYKKTEGSQWMPGIGFL